MQNTSIRTKQCLNCPVCGNSGFLIYNGLTDKIFQAPGVWNVIKCKNQGCRTLWLNPTPLEDDIPKLYAGYYTHHETGHTSSLFFRRLFQRAAAAYLHDRFGYDLLSNSLIDRTLGSLIRVFPVLRDALDSSIFHLNALPGGRLLEIGCGSGVALQRMKAYGWSVTGLDFDEGAVINAKKNGMDVRFGQLSAQGFPDKAFDAVVMGHVIEHVPSPDRLLNEILRMLKNNGILVALTPNASSPCHLRYKSNWRGLEIPRHLQVFTPDSLYKLAERIGYQHVKVFTTMNSFVYLDMASKELALNKKHVMAAKVNVLRRIPSHLKANGLGWMSKLRSDYEGEEIVLVCRK